MRFCPHRCCVTVVLGLMLIPPVASAQEMQVPDQHLLTFPLKAIVPGQDQHLTAATGPVNSVFDHSMLDSTVHYLIYGCDKVVSGFTGTTGHYGPGKLVFGSAYCNAGYKTQNVPFPAAHLAGARHDVLGVGKPGLPVL